MKMLAKSRVLLNYQFWAVTLSKNACLFSRKMFGPDSPTFGQQFDTKTKLERLRVRWL